MAGRHRRRGITRTSKVVKALARILGAADFVDALDDLQGLSDRDLYDFPSLAAARLNAFATHEFTGVTDNDKTAAEDLLAALLDEAPLVHAYQAAFRGAEALAQQVMHDSAGHSRRASLGSAAAIDWFDRLLAEATHLAHDWLLTAEVPDQVTRIGMADMIQSQDLTHDTLRLIQTLLAQVNAQVVEIRRLQRDSAGDETDEAILARQNRLLRVRIGRLADDVDEIYALAHDIFYTRKPRRVITGRLYHFYRSQLDRHVDRSALTVEPSLEDRLRAQADRAAWRTADDPSHIQARQYAPRGGGVTEPQMPGPLRADR